MEHPKEHVEVRDSRSKFSNTPQAEVLISAAEVPNLPARIAIDLVARWGMVAAAPDDEDSCGRQRSRLQDPVEVVTRAIQTADILCGELRRCGWLTPVPSLEEARGQLADAEHARDEAERERIMAAVAAAGSPHVPENGA